jgi:hypothetical protein
MYQRAIDGYEKALGPTLVVSYIPLLKTLENLADLYMGLGRSEDAWPYYQRAQVGAEAVWGRHSPICARLTSKINRMESK